MALNVGLLESLEEISKGKLIQNRREKGNLNMGWSRDYQDFSQLYWGAFHSTRKSGLNFRQLPVANGTAFSKISARERKLARYPQIFGNFSPEVFSLFKLLPEFLESYLRLNGSQFGHSTVSLIHGNFSW